MALEGISYSQPFVTETDVFWTTNLFLFATVFVKHRSILWLRELCARPDTTNVYLFIWLPLKRSYYKTKQYITECLQHFFFSRQVSTHIITFYLHRTNKGYYVKGDLVSITENKHYEFKVERGRYFIDILPQL